MPKKPIVLKLSLLVISLLLLLSQSSSADVRKISITGSSTLAPLAAEIAKRLENADSSFRVDVQTGGSSKGIADVIKGLSDIGMSSRSLFSGEEKLVDSHTVALDGVTFVIHRDNPIKYLSQQQLGAIYSGRITNWKELGGEDREITVIDRAKGRSEKELVKDYLGLKSSEYKPSVIAGENQQCIKLIEGNPGAIVYLSIGTTEFEQKRNSAIKALPLNKVEASIKNIKNGSFPIIRPLILVTRKNRSKTTKKFVEFALSTQVEDLVEGMAFVPPK